MCLPGVTLRDGLVLRSSGSSGGGDVHGRGPVFNGHTDRMRVARRFGGCLTCICELEVNWCWCSSLGAVRDLTRSNNRTSSASSIVVQLMVSATCEQDPQFSQAERLGSKLLSEVTSLASKHRVLFALRSISNSASQHALEAGTQPPGSWRACLHPSSKHSR